MKKKWLNKSQAEEPASKGSVHNNAAAGWRVTGET